MNESLDGNHGKPSILGTLAGLNLAAKLGIVDTVGYAKQ